MRRAWLTATIAVLGACLRGPVEKYPDGGQLVCDRGEACGPGTVCFQGFCVLDSRDAGDPDSGAPDAGNADGGADGGIVDGGPDDGGPPDGAVPDAGPGPYLSITLEQPIKGPVAGPVAVAARLVRSGPTVPSPASLTLLADGAVVGQITYSGSPDLVTDTFAASWSPGVEGPAVLVAVVARGSPLEVQSPPVAVDVDLNPPTITGVSTTCAASGCRWNAGFTVTASVADAHLDPSSVVLTLSRAGARVFGPTAMTGTGGSQFSLGVPPKLPFEALAGPLDLTIEARDTVAHVATAGIPQLMTRVLWSTPTGAMPTAPAIDSAGNVLVATGGGQLQRFGTSGALIDSGQLPTGGFETPAAIAKDGTIWAASDVGLYRFDAATLGPTKVCTGAPAFLVPPALIDNAAFAADSAGSIYFANAAGCETKSSGTGAGPYGYPTVVGYPTPGGPPLGCTWMVDYIGANETWYRTSICVTSRVLTSSSSWSVPSLASPVIPGAILPLTSGLFASNSGTIWQLGAGLFPPPISPPAKVSVAALPSVLPVGDANGVVFFGCDKLVAFDTVTMKIRYPASWSSACWSASVDVSPVLTTEPAVLVGFGQGLTNYDPATGSVRWSGQLASSAGATLTSAAISGGTLYIASSDGFLFAVAVEGDLDSAAPWPMLQRNNRHSGNALEPQ